MSTNFSWTEEGLVLARAMVDDARALRPVGDEAHIGKRWSAGWYCEDCHCWLEASPVCPQCRYPHPEYFRPPAVFDGPVRGRCGFTWAQDPEIVGAMCRRYAQQAIIVDEFDLLFYGDYFLEMLRNIVRRSVMDLIGVPHWC